MNVRASIAMAVCNGEKYLKEQIESIINMMDDSDELIISYDQSEDNTLNIVQEYEKRDSRIKVVYDIGRSVESNFNNAVAHCRGKYIFLADQDDVWINDKINKMIFASEAEPKAVVVIGDGYLCDENLVIREDISKTYRTSTSAIRNYIKGSYLGCQMMFLSDIKNRIWPVRVTPPIAHDLWLGILGAYYGKVIFLNDKFIMHRLHSDNYSNTSKMKLLEVIKNRIELAQELYKRIKRNKNNESKV